MKIYPKTIYADLVGLLDPIYLSFTVQMFNYSDIILYFQLTIQATYWSSNSVNLGSVGSGGNIYYNWDNASSRAKPGAAISETLLVTLYAYTDASYTDLFATFSRSISFVAIKSDDGSWTTDELDNFDDGTVEGWATGGGGAGTVAVVTDYVLSSPYSLKNTRQHTGGVPATYTTNIYKQFTTANKNNVFAIINLRYARSSSSVNHLSATIKQNGTILSYIDHPPYNKWIRHVVPLPKNVTLTIIIERNINWQGSPEYSYLWFDDFKIVSKN